MRQKILASMFTLVLALGYTGFDMTPAQAAGTEITGNCSVSEGTISFQLNEHISPGNVIYMSSLAWSASNGIELNRVSFSAYDNGNWNVFESWGQSDSGNSAGHSGSFLYSPNKGIANASTDGYGNSTTARMRMSVWDGKGTVRTCTVEKSMI